MYKPDPLAAGGSGSARSFSRATSVRFLGAPARGQSSRTRLGVPKTTDIAIDLVDRISHKVRDEMR